MVKTIKEMAEEHLKEKGYLLTTNNGVHMAEVEAIKMYEAGANAVLSKIEKELPKSDKQLNDYGKALLWRINEHIKELKGE